MRLNAEFVAVTATSRPVGRKVLTGRCRRARQAKAGSGRTRSSGARGLHGRPAPEANCSTQIPACLWFLARRHTRRGEILFIDERRLGKMSDRTHRELTNEEIARIADTHHCWQARKAGNDYADVPGLRKSTSLDEVRKHGYVQTRVRYVGEKPARGPRRAIREQDEAVGCRVSQSTGRWHPARRCDRREPRSAGIQKWSDCEARR